ncbi:MAG: DEAD/DEAH box helicase family protein [Bacteroidaceae bacterium]|nr:DEAD/DEAH box helicase family protein [Bacteroidaceae bacterium]
MLQEAKDLQQQAVGRLYELLEKKRELTFRAPTGSGKTHMMADLMQRVLAERKDVVFLVSTLSKGGLAAQNFEAFRRLADDGTFPALRPYLINTEIGKEECVHIPTDYNVYVLPRDLYKRGGRLMQGAMQHFLLTLTENFFGHGLRKQIYLIKDECHVATKNLDDISADFFARVLNFSATPNLARRQHPDVEITDEEAVGARLIKRIEFDDSPDVPVDAAIEMLIEKKEAYRNLLGVNPCLIVQISNKDKAEEEWTRRIRPALDKHQELKWMKIMDKDKECDTNDAVKKRLPVRRWKDYAKGAQSSIDVIVFKMVISEGWDIPRACMLYQVRDTQSRQLDEQVVGRVRRNPRLLDFDTLPTEAQQLATTAWVWGVRPDSLRRTQQVSLWSQPGVDLREQIRVKTTRLANLTQRQGFRVEDVLRPLDRTAATDIFTLHRHLSRMENEVQDLCYRYADGDALRWWQFAEQADKVRRAYNNFACDYAQSMEVGEETSLPATSSYSETEHGLTVRDWVWRKQGSTSARYSFDSEAETEWASVLEEAAAQYGQPVTEESGVPVSPPRHLWGKNFPQGSAVRYEYYDHGIHASYPDFVMKDREGRIHLFEVKSVNKAAASAVSEEDYKHKIEVLSACYKASSRLLPDHIFYLPVLRGATWHIHRFARGEGSVISEEEFRNDLSLNQ